MILVSIIGSPFSHTANRAQGQISGFLALPDFLERFGQQRDDGTFYFSNVRSGLIVAMLSIGTLIGALIGGPLADLIGRRYSITVWNVIFIVGNTVMISSDDKWYQIMMGRFVAGLGVGALSLLVPMYMAETGPRHIRGALIATYQLFITFGIFLAACINFGTHEHQRDNSGSWRIPMGVGYIWSIYLGIGILFFPETPRFNYRKGRIEEAKATMYKVYGAPPNHYSVHVELEEIEQKFRAESARNGPIQEWIQMLSAPKMGYRLLLGVLLQMFQQLTGANYFFVRSLHLTLSSIASLTSTVLRNRHLPGYRHQQLLRNANDSEWYQLRHNLLRSLHRGALRSSQVIDRRQCLDVHHVPHLCQRRPFLSRPRRPIQHRICCHRYDRHGILLHLRIRHYLGPYDLVSRPQPEVTRTAI